MNAKDKQIERIEYFESVFGRVSAAAGRLSLALEEFEKLEPELNELEAYYSGKLWKKDYADDEAGRLPPELKRGVLSEDGVYNLLGEIDEIRKALNPHT